MAKCGQGHSYDDSGYCPDCNYESGQKDERERIKNILTEAASSTTWLERIDDEAFKISPSSCGCKFITDSSGCKEHGARS